MPSGREWYEQGEKLKRDGDLPGALDAYRHALKANPRAAAAWVGLADVLNANQQPNDALECLKRGATAEPSNAVVVSKLARAYQGLGRVDEAERAYQRALSNNPNNTSALLGLGQLLEDKGEPEGAADAYRRLLANDPGNADALSQILGLGRHIDITGEIEQATARLDDAEVRDIAMIGYGLGKALDRMGRYDEAFSVLETANGARRQLTGEFNRDAFDKRIDALIEIFSAGFFAERRGWGDPSETPVFIVGLPRSGTTLTEQIIGSHPDCFGAGELPDLSDLATGTPDRLGRADPAWPTCAPELSEVQTQELGVEFVDRIRNFAGGEYIRISDKQPLNFWHLGLVALALPKATIIHCVRDIRDVGNSIFLQNFNPQQRWATDLSDIAYYWQGYRRLMAHWKSVTGLDIIDIAYEDTVGDLEQQARRLLDFLGLSWNDRVLAFHENERAVQTPSRWQVRQPLYKSSSAKWKNYEKHLAPLIDAATTAGL